MSEIQTKNIFDKKLKKSYQVLVPYSLIETRINKVVEDIRKNYKLDGFRKGQVPSNIIKQKYEASIMADESEKIINETSKKIISENNLKLALSPKVEIKTFEPKKDFEYVVSMELFPSVPEIDLGKIKIVKKEAEIGKEETDEFINKIVNHHRKWDKQDENYKAKNGDAVNIDYVGKIDKEAFEGGSAQGYQLELGSKSFIDNFEEQLVGKKAGDEVKVKVKFPKEYHNDKYAGKAAEFEVKINSVLTATKPELNDEFVKNNFGLENLAKLEEIAKEQVEGRYKTVSRNLFKKELFDFLNKKYDFDLPEGLVEEQLNNIWKEVEEELKQNPDKFKNEKEKEKAKEENRKLAERMIRSGIILSDLSEKNKITISNNDLIAEINKKAVNFPGQEQMVAQYYQNNPGAIQSLRGEILEEKVIDFILEKGAIEIKKLSVKEFDKLES
ncbi:MAG: trigger factor [Rickettsiaceae bacterium]|jgi:trigger factor|nr:trigger factor [Rickettsiaceae bacterium]